MILPNISIGCPKVRVEIFTLARGARACIESTQFIIDACPSATRKGKNFNTHFWAAYRQSSNGSSFCCVQDEDEDIFYFSCYQDNLKHMLNVYMR